jgi:hypothetical protein
MARGDAYAFFFLDEFERFGWLYRRMCQRSLCVGGERGHSRKTLNEKNKDTGLSYQED